MDIEEAVIAQLKEVATRGEVRHRILDRLFSDIGALTAAKATRAQLLARIEERNAESKRLLAAFSDADVASGKILAKRLGEIETDVDHLRIQLSEVEDRLRAFRGAQRKVERVARLLYSFGTMWSALVPKEKRELLHLLIGPRRRRLRRRPLPDHVPRAARRAAADAVRRSAHRGGHIVMDTNVVAFDTKSRKRAATARAPCRYPARIARQVALAHALQRHVDAGEFAEYADMARGLGFTRARLAQPMDLLLLAPDIQHEILHLQVAPGAQPISEPALREGVVRSLDWTEQRRAWSSLRRW